MLVYPCIKSAEEHMVFMKISYLGCVITGRWSIIFFRFNYERVIIGYRSQIFGSLTNDYGAAAVHHLDDSLKSASFSGGNKKLNTCISDFK